MSKESKELKVVIPTEKNGVFKGRYRNQWGRFELVEFRLGANLGFCDSDIRISNSAGYNVITLRAQELEPMIKALETFKTTKEYKTALKLDKAIKDEPTADNAAMKALQLENKSLLDRLAKLEALVTQEEGKEEEPTHNDIDTLFNMFLKVADDNKKKKKK